MDVSIDKIGTKNNHDKALKVVQSMQESCDLIDIWRQMNEDKSQFTWHCTKPRPTFVRLDFFLISESFMQFVEQALIESGYKSDHKSVRLKINLSTTKRGPGYWQLNTSLLHDRYYLEKINKLLDIEISNKFDSPKQKWEMIKLAISGSTVQYATRKKKSDKNKVLALEKKRTQLEQSLHNMPAILLERQQEQINLINKDINEIHSKKTRGAILRSRARWETFGEKPTKYFMNLEKRNFLKKTIFRIEVNGKILTNPTEILNAQRDFYKQLYTSKGSIDKEYIESVPLPKISDEMRSELDKPVTSQELGQALEDLNNNKAAGCDGIPPDLYKVFWSKLEKIYFEMIIQSINKGQLHLTARRGIISLLEKISKNTLLLQNWRPLSLLNGDLKIFTKMIANRMKSVLADIIHPSQTGFLPGRHIGNNIMKLLNLMDFCERTKTSAIIISIDFQKAFDKIEWEAIYQTLEKYNIGPYLINLIKVAYNKPLSCTMNNGYWSEFFELSRACRQGCPLSSLTLLD